MEHNLEPIRNQTAPPGRLTIALVLTGLTSLLLIGIGMAVQIDGLKGIGSLLVMIYIIVLIWWLATLRPKADELPDFSPILNTPRSYGAMLGLISILTGAAFIWAGIIMGNGWLMFPASATLAIVVLIVLRKQINAKIILTAGSIAVVLFIVEIIFQFRNTSGSTLNSLLLALLLSVQAAAGVLLLKHSQLTKFQLYEGNLFKAIQSFGWGCLLAIPPALLNIASLTKDYLSEFDRGFDQGWKAFYALQPGILEETWARLFLLTLFYTLLRPTSSQKPQRALLVALFISVFVHGLAHYPQSLSDPASAIVVAMLYGIPLGLIYIKLDFESAIAYHFFIDFVRFAFTVSLVS